VKDVAAERDTLIHVFERIHFFVQRLNGYTGIPLTNEFTELLGKIMAQILSILAISTKAMAQRRMSVSPFTYSISFLADYGSEKLLEKLIGRRDVEDALLRLDFLTKEESLMAVARNLEVADHIDGNVDEIKVLAEGIDDKVQRVDENVKTANERTQWFLSVFVRVLTLFSRCILKQEWMNFDVCHSLTVPSLTVKADARSQEINCKRSFKNGSLLPTLPSTTIMRVKLSIVEPQVGLFKAAHFENGKRTGFYCGFLVIVSFLRPFCQCSVLTAINSFVLAGAGKSVLWCVLFCLFLL